MVSYITGLLLCWSLCCPPLSAVFYSCMLRIILRALCLLYAVHSSFDASIALSQHKRSKRGAVAQEQKAFGRRQGVTVALREDGRRNIPQESNKFY